MAKVDLNVIGKKTDPVAFEYTWRDVVLYALGVGVPAEDLEFIYENAAGGLKVLPSFCVVPAIKAFPFVGKDIEWSLFLHGQHSIRLARPIPPEGRLVQVGEVMNIYDKGKGALYDILIKGKTEDGLSVYEVRWGIFYVGAGGFGGDPGPKAEPLDPPTDLAPDFTVSHLVAQNQAAIYRLSGDFNPLHLDPAAAKVGGFDRPILHGLCTYGFATRAIVRGALDGDATRLGSFKARFSSVVYPGDTLITEGWKEGDRYIVQSKTDRGIALSQAVAEITP